MDTKNYTRTDNPDGSVTFTPVKVSKRFVPKWEEVFWLVNSSGKIMNEPWFNHTVHKCYLAIGNVYRTQIEATKARDKQLALVRIQNYIADNDLGKEFVFDENNYSIFYIHVHKRFEKMVWYTSEMNTPLGYLKSIGACDQVIENCKEDLLIVFGKV